MTREQGLKEIEQAKWEADDTGTLNLLVTTEDGMRVHAWLTRRPHYCDRGHVQLNIDGPLNLDRHDSFPRYFFSVREADDHARMFLKWRLWKERTVSERTIHADWKLLQLFGELEEAP